jgi:hypothetical protein
MDLRVHADGGAGVPPLLKRSSPWSSVFVLLIIVQTDASLPVAEAHVAKVARS